MTGNSLGSSSSPPPRDRIRRDISPKSGVEAGGQRPGYAEAGGQNRQIAYSGALRTAPARRRLPQVRNNEYHSRSVVGHWDVDQ